jgi:hypothetical protein
MTEKEIPNGKQVVKWYSYTQLDNITLNINETNNIIIRQR